MDTSYQSPHGRGGSVGGSVVGGSVGNIIQSLERIRRFCISSSTARIGTQQDPSIEEPYIVQ